MGWLYTWLRDRAFHLPSNLNSGGDWMRRYKKEIYGVLDALAEIYKSYLPDPMDFAKDIVDNIKLPDLAKHALQLYLYGVVDNAFDKCNGDIINVVNYLKAGIDKVP